jgi:hypothetical protein
VLPSLNSKAEQHKSNPSVTGIRLHYIDQGVEENKQAVVNINFKIKANSSSKITEV